MDQFTHHDNLSDDDALNMPSFVFNEDDDAYDQAQRRHNQQRTTLLTAIVVALLLRPKKRQSYCVRNRLEWEIHVQTLHEEGSAAFLRVYRMSHASFTMLNSLLEPHITQDRRMATVRTNKGPIILEIILHCLLCWLAGESYLDI